MLIGVFVKHIEFLYLLTLLLGKHELFASRKDNDNNPNQTVNLDYVKFISSLSKLFHIFGHLNYVMLTYVLMLGGFSWRYIKY